MFMVPRCARIVLSFPHNNFSCPLSSDITVFHSFQPFSPVLFSLYGTQLTNVVGRKQSSLNSPLRTSSGVDRGLVYFRVDVKAGQCICTQRYEQKQSTSRIM